MVEVEGSQEFEAWFLTLAEKDAEAGRSRGWSFGGKGRVARFSLYQ